MYKNSGFTLNLGFTLVELVIAIAVAGVVISGVVVTSAQLVKRTADPMMSVQRVHIAQAYLEEIQGQSFLDSDNPLTTHPSVNCGNIDRENYTYICHYRALINKAVEDQFGNVPPGLSNYKVTVSVNSSNSSLQRGC